MGEISRFWHTDVTLCSRLPRYLLGGGGWSPRRVGRGPSSSSPDTARAVAAGTRPT
jgi:hypothetical protein